MKIVKFFPLGFMLLLILTSCSQAAQNESLVEIQPTEEVIPYRNPALYQTNLVTAAQEYASLVETATIYAGEIEIDSSLQLVQGNLQVYFINNEEAPLSEIYFRLFPNFNGGEYTIEAVKVDGAEATWELTSRATSLQIALPQPLQVGEELKIALSFSLSIPAEMGGNYDIFGYVHNILALDNLLPTIPVYDEAGWHIDTPSSNGDLPFLDASFYHLQITAPEEMVLASSGTETITEVNAENGMQTIEVVAGPIRDLYLSASPDYTVKTIVSDETEINIYLIPEYDLYQDEVLEITQNALTLFGEQFGAYPYTEFDIATSPVASAMEYPGIIAIGFDILAEGSPISPYPEMLTLAIVHEIAHQWFYNMVGNNQAAQPWLDETFAQYLTHLYFQEIKGSSTSLDIYVGASWDRINREETPIGLPVSEYQSTKYAPIVYSRGLHFFIALEGQLGKDMLTDITKDYFQSHLWQIAGPDDFKNTAEAKCECDLSELWQAWVLP